MNAGFSDDYALLIAGLLDLYEAGGGLGWLAWAVTLQDTLDSLFWDGSSGEEHLDNLWGLLLLDHPRTVDGLVTATVTRVCRKTPIDKTFENQQH